MTLDNEPMHNCDNANNCDNGNSITVLEVKIARIEKLNTLLSSELDKAKTEITKRNDNLELQKYIVDVVFSKKVMWLILFVSFIYNLLKT